jgi:hypothetical protein
MNCDIRGGLRHRWQTYSKLPYSQKPRAIVVGAPRLSHAKVRWPPATGWCYNFAIEESL